MNDEIENQYVAVNVDVVGGRLPQINECMGNPGHDPKIKGRGLYASHIC